MHLLRRGILYRCELVDKNGKRQNRRRDWVRVFVIIIQHEMRAKLLSWPAGGRLLDDFEGFNWSERALEALDQIDLCWCTIQDYKFEADASGLIFHCSREMQRVALKLLPDQGLATLQEWRTAMRKACSITRTSALDRTSKLLQAIKEDNYVDELIVPAKLWWPGGREDDWISALNMSVRQSEKSTVGDTIASRRILQFTQNAKRVAKVMKVRAIYSLDNDQVIIEGQARWQLRKTDAARLPMVDKLMMKVLLEDANEASTAGYLGKVLSWLRDQFELVYPRIADQEIPLSRVDSAADLGRFLEERLVESRPFSRLLCTELYEAYAKNLPKGRKLLNTNELIIYMKKLGYCLKAQGTERVVTIEEVKEQEKESKDWYWHHLCLKVAKTDDQDKDDDESQW